MADAQPTMTMGDAQMAPARYDSPRQTPPAFNGAMAQAVPAVAPPAAPPDMQAAPSLPSIANAVSAVSAWQNNKKVDGLWTINQDGNSWMSVAGVGWKKLAHVDETSITALTVLAAHARSTNANINYREEADGKVHEIYVW